MADIRKASVARDGALRQFYEAAFPERAAFLSEHWEWLYRVGRFPGIEPLVAVENERVIGHAGAIPVMVSRLGVVAPAIWFVDFKILPEFQGKGHGKALTEAWMAMCPDRITFCNERSMAVFRTLGWHENSNACVRSVPFELGGPLRTRFGLARDSDEIAAHAYKAVARETFSDTLFQAAQRFDDPGGVELAVGHGLNPAAVR